VWSDTIGLRLLGADCPSVDVPGSPTAFNVYTLEVTNTGVTILVNGGQASTCIAGPKIKSLYIGNPAAPGGPTEWSTLKVDYIRVEKGVPLG
jgi:hypothetical protein